ncbi:EXLDI protein [Nocardia jiangxiensis]|uniref:EXLDI protein n=1 Tax=Nocardia jiangxiensis TaxID=282685 RepID=A0ABW6RRY7_9NOCA|nr:EXLDI protein [Nocardia jiangxiensis]
MAIDSQQPVSADTPDSTDAAAEFTTVELADGPAGARTKRFEGRFVVQGREFGKREVEVTKVYQGRSGKFVVQRQRFDWAEMASRANFQGNWKNWLSMLGGGGFGVDLEAEPTWGDYEVEVVDTLDDLRGLLSAKLHRRVVAVVEQPRIEYLDI